jgi:hypothetical protein
MIAEPANRRRNEGVPRQGVVKGRVSEGGISLAATTNRTILFAGPFW